MYKIFLAVVAGFLAVGCDSDDVGVVSGQVSASDSISELSDEFESSDLRGWKRIHQTEGWNAEQLKKIAVEGGQLVLVPHASSWYQDYRGVLVYKEVAGDFVVTTKVSATGMDGRSAPRSQYSLGGIMVRSPRMDTAQSWRPGQENYVFLSVGSADQPGNFQFEVKTTQQSNSQLEKISAASGEALLQVARIGSNLIMLRKQGGDWVVHKRYQRGDMPSQLQVGLTVYTDYPTISRVQPREHNSTVIQGGNPDLLAKFDFVRYRRPVVPAGMDVARASDAELLKFLGDSAM